MQGEYSASKSMSDVSELIYETCKAYLIQQGKFLLILEVFIGIVMIVEYSSGYLRRWVQ